MKTRVPLNLRWLVAIFLFAFNSVQLIAAPVNDNFANAILITNFPAATSGDTTGATVEPGEPGGLPAQKSVWWKWVPDFTGRVGIIDNGSVASAWIKVLAGSQFDSLTNLASTGLYGAGVVVLNVTAGSTYYFAVDINGENSAVGPVGFKLVNLPTNDNFADAKPLVGTMVEDFADNSLATLEDGEPDFSAGWQNHSLWWTWTAPQNDTVRVSVTGSGFTPWVHILTGDTLTNLTLVTQNNYGSDVSFAAVAGTTYKIRVVGGFSIGLGAVRLTLYSSRPLNDDFENRMPVSGIFATPFGTTIGATAQAADPEPVSGGRSVWYSWTAPMSGRLIVAATNLINHPLIPRFRVGIYTNTQSSSLQAVASGQDGAAVMVISNQTYAIGVDGDSGDFRIGLNELGYPANDNFTNRLVLTDAQPLVTNDNSAATIEPGEKSPAKGMANASIWYQWTAPASGLVRFYASAGFAPEISVYKGTSLKKLKKVANSLNMASAYAFCELQVQAGDTFVFSVDGRFAGGRGTVMVGVDVTTFQISSPAANSVISAAAPPLFSVNTPSPLVDGALQSVTYIAGQANGVTRTVGFSSTPPFSVTPTNLPVGAIGLVVVGTNVSGDARVSAAIPLIVRPVNDDFADSPAVEGYHWQVEGVTAQATKEKGEPNSGAASVWWTWTAPGSGTAEIEAQLGEDRSPLSKRSLVVYSGTSFKELKRVKWTSTTHEPDAPQYFDFNVVGGTTYQIVVAAKSPNLDPGFDPFLLRCNLTSLQFTEPTTNVFNEPADVPVGVVTTENPADIQRVDFFASDRYETNEPIGSVSTPPYRFIWSNAPPGDYSLEARLVKFSGPTPLVANTGVSIRPLNDDFANAILIETNFTWMTHRIAGATREPGEPSHLNGQLANALNSAWWTWTAPADGRIYVGNPNGDPAAGAGVYTGKNVAALVRVPNHNDPFFGPNEVVDVVQGTTYHIAAFPGSVPNANMQLRFYPPPPNDNFSNRTVLTGTNVEMAGYTVGATRETNEPYHGGFTQTHTIWWSWTAPGRGHATLRQDAGSWMILSVYTGSSLDALHIVSSDGSMYGGWDFEVQPGVTYQIAMVSYWGNEEHVAANLNFSPTAANDSFAGRKNLDGTNLVFAADNRGATVEQGEPPLAPNGTGRTLWWTWTAPADGNFYLAAPGSYSWINGMLSVYTGNSLDTLQLVSAGDIFRLAIHVTSNTTYQIRVDTSNYNTDPASVSLNFIPAPANDNFSNAAVLSGLNVATNGTVYGSSDETAWPTVKGGETVWYSWTATTSQSVIVRVTGNLTIHAYLGENPTNLVAAGVQHNFDALLLNPQPGRTYFFELFGQDLWEPDYPWAGTYELFLSPGNVPANDNLVNAQLITSTPVFVQATNWVASVEPTDPAIVQWDNLKRTIWYRWQAPGAGLLSVTNAGSDMDLVIAMWFGTNFGQWTSGAINGATLTVASNDVVSILVDGNSGVGGVIRLNFDFTPAVQNSLVSGFGNSLSQSTGPGLSLAAGLSNGQFTLNISGASGSPYKVEWSADMIHWQTLQTGTLTNGVEEVTDPNATSPARFYRLAP